jgi:hypothetical protein
MQIDPPDVVVLPLSSNDAVKKRGLHLLRTSSSTSSLSS